MPGAMAAGACGGTGRAGTGRDGAGRTGREEAERRGRTGRPFPGPPSAEPGPGAAGMCVHVSRVPRAAPRRPRSHASRPTAPPGQFRARGAARTAAAAQLRLGGRLRSGWGGGPLSFFLLSCPPPLRPGGPSAPGRAARSRRQRVGAGGGPLPPPRRVPASPEPHCRTGGHRGAPGALPSRQAEQTRGINSFNNVCCSSICC